MMHGQIAGVRGIHAPQQGRIVNGTTSSSSSSSVSMRMYAYEDGDAWGVSMQTADKARVGVVCQCDKRLVVLMDFHSYLQIIY